MPTPEEIKKIAREYAKWHGSIGTGITEDMLNWLSKDYCIVPRKSVAKWVNDIEFFMPDKRSVTMLKIGAKSLFGKSLFNEEKI